jgi:hypothetical protein
VKPAAQSRSPVVGSRQEEYVISSHYVRTQQARVVRGRGSQGALHPREITGAIYRGFTLLEHVVSSPWEGSEDQAL